ncbi:hypothetical protein Tco_1112524 [Tanacetum coccineum]|uniref:Uncharacterized protein n=1 Tax=Tanacetum coccineum TaxID=301880 RepID=A0ABQ5IPL7_9ASTR
MTFLIEKADKLGDSGFYSRKIPPTPAATFRTSWLFSLRPWSDSKEFGSVCEDHFGSTIKWFSLDEKSSVTLMQIPFAVSGIVDCGTRSRMRQTCRQSRAEWKSVQVLGDKVLKVNEKIMEEFMSRIGRLDKLSGLGGLFL